MTNRIDNPPPSYRWVCHVCDEANAAGTTTCVRCGGLATLAVREIETLRAEFIGPTVAARRPSRTAITFYVIVFIGFNFWGSVLASPRDVLWLGGVFIVAWGARLLFSGRR